MTTVAALYVDPRGPYPTLLDEARKDLERAQQMVTALEELNRALEG